MSQSPVEAPEPVGNVPTSAESFLDVLQVRPVEEAPDHFHGPSHPMPHDRIYGGQVLAQSVMAASLTLPPERGIHSMHGYFLRPGDVHRDVTYGVDRLREGRSFSTRRTQGFQRGVPIFSMIASFQEEEVGLEHQVRMPEVPQPEELEPMKLFLGMDPRNPQGPPLFQPMEIRPVEEVIYEKYDPQPARQSVWMRIIKRLPDDPLIHRAALAYLSDMSLQGSVLRAHGLPWTTPGLRVASLDHAIWWHRAARADEWLLYTQASDNSRGGRGLARGKIFDQEGTLIASVAQEMMIRLPR